MTTTDPEFLYTILIMPSLFGLTLVGEGLNKVFHEEWHGLISFVAGISFLGLVVFAFLFFSAYFGPAN